MAANAIEQKPAAHVNLLRALVPRPGQLQFATRLGLICTFTTLVTEIYQTPEQALAAYFPFFFNRPERTATLLLSTTFTLIVTAVIALLFILLNAVVNDTM